MADSDQYILSIDLGSGGPKVALVSQRGKVGGFTQRRTSTIQVADGGVEQDPREWWKAISEAARSLLAQGLVRVESIVAVVCAAQWSVTVPVDATGQPLMNAVHWMDSRGAAHSRKLMDGLLKIEGYGVLKLLRWLRLTGAAPTHSGADVLSHLLFLKHDRPDIYRQTHKFLEPADYLGLCLTGRIASSYASVFPYFLTDNRDASHVRYDEGLLRLTGLDVDKLPELVPVDTILGTILPEVAADWGLAPSTKVMIGAGDSHAAILGSGAIEDGQAHLCIGTSSWMTCLIPKRRIDAFHSITSMPAIVPGRFMVTAEQGPAGKLLEMFVERWFGGNASTSEERFAEMLAAAENVPAGALGVRFLPWLNGAGPPAQTAYMRGGFLNLSLQSTPAHAVRAILEGVACNIRWLAERVERMAGRPNQDLNYIGGGARSALWCQIFADVLDRRIHQVADPNLAIARGAAFSAFLALKILRLEDIPDVTSIQATFEPDAEVRNLYDDLYCEFLRTFRATRPLFRRWEGSKRSAASGPLSAKL